MKQSPSNSQKSGDGKSCNEKQEEAGDLNVRSSVQHTEKHLKGPHNSNNPVSLCSRNDSWTLLDNRHIINEVDMKDRSMCTKYDEPEGGYSNSSTPLFTIKNKRKLGKRNSNNSDASSVSESLHEIPVLKKSWGSVFSRSSQGVSSLKSRQVDAELKETANTASCMDVDSNSKKNVESGKDSKRLSQAFKKNKVQPEPMICSEEETSSTTTESSNNDEVDKVCQTDMFYFRRGGMTTFGGQILDFLLSNPHLKTVSSPET
jgi:hypothetical protein